MPLPIIAGTLASAALGIGQGAINDARQIQQQGILNKQQMTQNQQMAQFNYDQQMRMWRETGYGGQMNEMIKAGLNPALMYGQGGGASGTVNAQSGDVNAAKAPTGGGEIQAQMAMGMQRELLDAQKENIKADTVLKQQQAAKTGGVDTTEGQARIENTKQQTTNAGIEQKQRETELKIRQESAGDVIDRISYETRTALQELQSATVKAGIDRGTISEQMTTIKARAIGAVIDNAIGRKQVENISADTTLKKQQRDASIQQLMQNWDEMGLKTRKLSLEKIMTEYNTSVSPELKVGLDVIEQAVDGILRGGKR